MRSPSDNPRSRSGFSSTVSRLLPRGMAAGRAMLMPIFLGSLRDSTSVGLEQTRGSLHNQEPYRKLKNPLPVSHVSGEERENTRGFQMRRFISIAVAGVALVLAAPATTATTTVQIKSTGFVPATVTINQGDSVTWTNADTKDHQVVSNGGAFASAILNPGKTYTHAFPNGGTYRYHDGLHPTLRGTITVKGAPPQVTLAVSAPVVKFGTQVTLTGVVNNKRTGETVTLTALPFGQTTKQVVATLQTTSGGAFSFNLAPQLNTTYQAQWKGAESSVGVQVQPTIKLPFVSRWDYFHFYVTAGESFAGRFVYLQRFTLARTWINVRRLQLGHLSGRIMRLKFVRSVIPRGRWSIRIYMAASDMPGGYIDSWSATQPVVKR